MNFAVILIGVVASAIGVILVAKPGIIPDLFRKHAQSLVLQVATVLVSLLCGLVFLGYADDSKFPVLLTVVGLIAIMKAMLNGLLSRTDFGDLNVLVLSAITPFGRAIGLIEIAFGCFLIWAAI
jgi:hypothetical protein